MPMTFGPSSVTGRHVRSAMLGRPMPDLHVLRQARRIRRDDSDELGLLCVGDRSWWVARRVGEHLTVWAFAGDEEAADGFERELREPGWFEAMPPNAAA